jgi:hypothetical protein
VRRSCDEEKLKISFEGGDYCSKKFKRGAYGGVWQILRLAGVWSGAVDFVSARLAGIWLQSP